MDSFDRSRGMSAASVAVQPYPFHTTHHFATEPPRLQTITAQPTQEPEKTENTVSFMKGPKRKRLAKACDACHKSKRRCDGTAPCSNCYFASKSCTYTDGSGRPVPAPRVAKERNDPPPNDSRQQPAYGNQMGERFPHGPSYSPNIPNGYSQASSSHVQLEHSDGERSSSRKRFRTERGTGVAATDIPMDSGPPPNFHSADRQTGTGLDHALTRELTNLFFTHCHPQRIIVHKPSFASALSHNQVPLYLLHAVCALAAPLSKQPRIRTNPSRDAGKRFAQEAAALMFNGNNELIVERNLATAQALCLLIQLHEARQPSRSARYYDLALQIVEDLGVHKPDIPTLTPVPSPEFIQASIERECVRRIFWLTHLMDLQASIYYKRPVPAKDSELLLRLPADETTFEMAVHSTLPEYIYLPAPRVQYASEFGHLLRVYSIYSKVESLLDAFSDPDSKNLPIDTLYEVEQLLDSWSTSLPDHLRFSEDSLQVQLSMFETSSNSGAWCYCYMHSIHASSALALNLTRQRGQRGVKNEPHWAPGRLDLILSTLGGRAKNSCLMGSVLFGLIKYCKRDDGQIRTWLAEYEESSGVNVEQLVMNERNYQAQQQQQQQQQQVQYVQQHQRMMPHPGTSQAHNQPLIHRAPPQHRDGVDGSFPPPGYNRSPSSSPPFLGRSFKEMGIHGHASHPSVGGGSGSREMEVKRMITDSDIDPALQNGGQPSQRGHPVNMDGAHSLPSLKASGLLDSWSKETPMQQRQSAPRAPPNSIHFVQDNDLSRHATSSMPVGLPWLANES